MKKYIAIAMMCVVATGCSFAEFGEQSQQKAAVIVGATEAGEPVIVSLEDATGMTLAPELVEKGAMISGKVATISRLAQGLATAGAAVPVAAPYAIPLAGVLGALNVLAVGVAGFFKRRADRNASAVTTMIKATEPLAGSGAAVKSALPSAVVGDIIEEAYKAVKNG